MQKWMTILLASMLAGLAQNALAEGALKEAFTNGKTKGAIRVYRNDRHFPSAQDTSNSSAGGNLHYETDTQDLFSGGMTFYAADNMGINSRDPAKLNPILPADNIEILGEAYLQAHWMDSTLTAGRQLFNSPFANPSDAFMIPVTYSGYSLINKSFKNLVIQLAQLEQIKNRQSASFVNTGLFLTQRYLAASQARETAGTSVADVTWADQGMSAEASIYHFADVMDMAFVDFGYDFKNVQPLEPYVDVQYVNQMGTGAKLLGDVGAQLYGAKVGAKWNRFDFSLGYNTMPANSGKFMNGGVAAPFTFFTEPLYTNSMLTGPVNNEAGNAYKAMILWSPFDNFNIKLSHAALTFKNYKNVSTGVNQAETDLWFAYKLSGAWDGFSVELRMAKVDADQDAKDVSEYRSQLQYVF